MDREALEELKTLCEKATSGPWGTYHNMHGWHYTTPAGPVVDSPSQRLHDVEFIAAARLALPKLIAEVEQKEAAKNGAYAERNKLVAGFANMAMHMGWVVAVTRTAIEGWEPEWHNCVYIETPSGQLSWHFHDSEMGLLHGLPRHEQYTWDGHTTEQKYERLARMFSPALQSGGSNETEGGP